MKKLLSLIILLLCSSSFAQYERNGRYCVRMDGAEISCHNELHTAFNSLRDVVLQNPGSVVILEPPVFTYRPTVDPQPDPHPEPTPDPEPLPDPEPIPEPIPNPQPSEYRGIPDPSQAMGFDIYGDYPVNQTFTGNRRRENIFCEGTASAPCLVNAGGATFEKITLLGSYVILQGGQVNAPAASGPWVDAENCDHCIIRDVIVSGPGVDNSHSAAVGLGDYVVWLRGKIHGFGDNRKEAREQDYHGIKACGQGPMWILEAEIYNNSGDSVQTGDATRCVGSNIYIGGGWYHDNRENGVDMKDGRNVVVSGVRMSGFSPTNSDPGSAIVVHDDAFYMKIYDNIITDSTIGIVSSGDSGHEITGNNVTAFSEAFQCRGSTNMTVTDNVFTAPTPVNINGVCDGNVQQQ